MNPILNIVSIRVKAKHIDPLTGSEDVLKSINQAKLRSRQLGGAGKVRALRAEDLRDFRKAYLIAHFEEKQMTLAREVDAAKAVLDSAEATDQREQTEVSRKAFIEAQKAYDRKHVNLIGIMQELVRIRKGEF